MKNIKKNIKKNIGVIFLSIVLILIFFLGRSCGNTPKTDLKTITDTLIVHKIDTIRDTVSIVKIKIKPILKDSIKIQLDSSLFKGLSYKRIYENTYRDSNIVINSQDTVIGYQTSKIINYKLLVPYKIYDSTIVKITKDSLIYQPSKYQLSAGIISSPKMLAPVIDFSVDKWSFMTGYDPFNKQILVGGKYRIYRSKK